MRCLCLPYWGRKGLRFLRLGPDDGSCRIAQFACDDCATVEGCEEHQVFRCGTCCRATFWADGAADDRPDDCAKCWQAWHEPRAILAQGLARLLDPGC